MFERPQIVERLLAEQVRAVSTARERPDVVGEARAVWPESGRERFEAALAYAQRGYAVREDNIYWLDNYPCALLRYCAVEIGRRLTERDLIARDEDAVYLEAAELERALLVTDPADLRPTAARRKADPGSRLPGATSTRPFQYMIGSMRHVAIPAGTQDELRGVPASPGRYPASSSMAVRIRGSRRAAIRTISSSSSRLSERTRSVRSYPPDTPGVRRMGIRSSGSRR